MFSLPERRPATVLARPERPWRKAKPLDQWAERIAGVCVRPWAARTPRFRRLLPAIHRWAKHYSAMDSAALDDARAQLRRALGRGFSDTELLAQAFALVREYSGRTLGMYQFDTQLLGGLALFHGAIAEMQTGEGKTLTAVLPAAVAALGGVPVHLVTANDYLAARDAQEMGPVYRALGLSVGLITAGLSVAERRAAYACDLVYCSNNELAFDYLKDQLQLGGEQQALARHRQRLCGDADIESGLVLRGLHFAIVDEADSVLLDEARTPLIISGSLPSANDAEPLYREAINLARMLEPGVHFQLQQRLRSVRLTEHGCDWLDLRAAELGPYWRGRVRRIELVEQALRALHCFARDQHYLVRDDQVQIIDEHSGRVLAGRSWEQGLHQLIEVKEGCPLSAPRSTLAKISYQRFFRLYQHLGGMTGTGREVTGELWNLYRLPLVPVPVHCPSRRRYRPARVALNRAQKWVWITERAAEVQGRGQPLLIGTVSVAASRELSDRFTRAGLAHRVLNADQDAEEAQIVAAAGQPGQITIATSMAGRGTDIKLAQAAEEAGGLYVILSELQESARIDRQLVGRCARFGDPGEVESILSLDDTLLAPAARLRALLEQLLERRAGQWLTRTLMRQLQARIERRHARARRQLLKRDQQHSELLAFASRRT